MKRRNRFIVFFGCFLALIIFVVPSAAQTKKEKELAKKLQADAETSMRGKKFREAVELYGRSLTLVPSNPEAHYKKSTAHYNLKEKEQAVNELTLALNQGYKPIDIYRLRYYILFEQGSYDAALADIQKGLQLVPNDLGFLNMVGEISYIRKQFPEALAAFQKASQVAPNDADIFYNLGRVSFAMGDKKAQMAAAETALAKGTRFPGEAFFLLGEANDKLKNASGAIDAYQKALGVKPKMYEIYRSLAEIFRSEGRFTDAINILKKGLIEFPNEGAFYTDLGLYYSLAGRSQDAVDAAKSGVTILPSHPDGYTNLCRAYNETKKFDLAVSACNRSLLLRPDHGETYYYLGNAFANLNKGSEATRAYSSAVKGLNELTAKYPDQSEGWYLLGNARFADQQLDKAIEAYLKCLSISPKFLKARLNLGISYTRKKNKVAAVEQYNLIMAADASLAAKLKAEIDKM